MSDFKELDDKLTCALIKAVYGFHCMASGKVYSDQNAYDEYLGKWDLAEGLKYPFMRNIIQSLKSEIYARMDFKINNKE